MARDGVNELGAANNTTGTSANPDFTCISKAVFGGTDGTLSKFYVYKNNDANSATYWRYRAAVYLGGTTDSIENATLLWDSGVVGSESTPDTETPDGRTVQWYEIDCQATYATLNNSGAIPASSRVWMCVKTNQYDIHTYTDTSSNGDMEAITAGGRALTDNATSGHNNTATAYPATYGSVNFGNGYSANPWKFAIEYATGGASGAAKQAAFYQMLRAS